MNRPFCQQRCLFFCALLIAALESACIVLASDVQKQPHDVLFIAVDDLNDWTGHLKGHVQASTPNIDRLVNRGMVFTNAHCAAPACNPSRAALMSGMRPFETGIYVNSSPSAKILKNTLTINRHFLAHGYNVLGGGKIYHGFQSEGREDTLDTLDGQPQNERSSAPQRQRAE